MDENNNIDDRMVKDKKDARMEQNSPNPAKGSTVINCYIPSETVNAYIQIYNAMGGMVLKLPIGTKGQNEIHVDTYKLPNGIYIYSLVTDGRLIDTKRMIIAN